jgi:pyrroloquinoline quinone biosynthesis protein E
LTLNVVLHRESIPETEAVLELAVELGISRIELAQVQYHGFALKNRDALLPDGSAIDSVRRIVREARARFAGKLEITHVLPDYHAGRPKACMDGWGQRYIHHSATSGATHRASTPSAAMPGCGNRAGVASGVRSTSADAAVRPSH